MCSKINKKFIQALLLNCQSQIKDEILLPDLQKPLSCFNTTKAMIQIRDAESRLIPKGSDF